MFSETVWVILQYPTRVKGIRAGNHEGILKRTTGGAVKEISEETTEQKI